MKKSVVSLYMILLLISCGKDSDIIQQAIENPTDISLAFPEKNSECTAGIIISEIQSEVIFNWSEDAGSDKYHIALTDLTNGENQLFESDSTSLPITLKRGNPYEWFVVSEQTATSRASKSDTEAFYNAGPGVESYIPFPAGNIAPLKGATIPASQSTITLEWQATDLDNDVLDYDIYFGVSNPPELFSTNVTATTLADIAITTGTVYYWKVLTKDSLGNQSNSEVFSFEVLN